MHIGNNNCPFPTRPALRANSGGIEDGLVVVAISLNNKISSRVASFSNCQTLRTKRGSAEVRNRSRTWIAKLHRELFLRSSRIAAIEGRVRPVAGPIDRRDMQARLSGFAVVCVEHDNVATRFLQYGFTAGTRPEFIAHQQWRASAFHHRLAAGVQVRPLNAAGTADHRLVVALHTAAA